ncbi:2-oxoacid:acceptor oxidoreductase family protein [Methanofollis tationis]|uniref:2-oxoacid:acceptor oxidoreductase family protein n=2 Tax=Methanofollis tationis TaxID=81417 RepID=A0A7K4HQY4_9EURY|nr:2-oxoacid:acceptor oxidoreductase family protein [Methanofollis tationis]
MQDFSVLIGGKAGEGINIAGSVIARLLSACGLCVYMYYDYPSLIKGGNNFAVIRAADDQTFCTRETVDVLLALNQETIRLHAGMVREDTAVIYDSGVVKAGGTGLTLDAFVKEEEAPAITRSAGIIGGFCRTAGIPWATVEAVFARAIPRELDANLRVARRGYDASPPGSWIRVNGREALPVLTGNEGIAFGLVEAGLEGYISYPMTPSSSILHTLASYAGRFGISVVHPENETGAMLMALGAAYAGRRVAVGTSGGGFCLMTEGFSLAGMAELPVAVVLAQRPGPSTGVPTYSAQGDLLFALFAGQGEFPRIVAAPGSVEEAWYWAGALMDLSWRFQTPAILLTDKNLGEGLFSFAGAPPRPPLAPVLREGDGKYGRYQDGPGGISPLAFPGESGITVKVNSYAHDADGITTEEATTIAAMAEKRREKERAAAKALAAYPCVEVAGDRTAATALLCWGSVAGVCAEVAGRLGLRVVRPVVLSPFPEEQLASALLGVGRLIAVEENIDGQLSRLVGCHGIRVDERIGKYDGRPFFLEDLERRVGEVI